MTLPTPLNESTKTLKFENFEKATRPRSQKLFCCTAPVIGSPYRGTNPKQILSVGECSLVKCGYARIPARPEYDICLTSATCRLVRSLGQRLTFTTTIHLRSAPISYSSLKSRVASRLDDLPG